MNLFTMIAFGGVLVAWYMDSRRHAAMLRDVLSRISTEAPLTLEGQGPATQPPLDPQPYISDLPYHDVVWDDFVAANETPEDVE